MATYRILFIDDEEIDRMAFERFVKRKKLSFEYQLCSNFKEVKGVLADFEPDVVFTDFQLGDGDAFDVIPLFKDTPVVLITGHGDEEVSVKAFKAGVYDYLIKDQKQNYLKLIPHIVERAVELTKAKRELEEHQKNLENLVKERTVKLETEIAERKKIEQTLEQKNIALREILSELEREKKLLGDRVLANADNFLLPTLRKLKMFASEKDRRLFELLEKNLNELTSEFGTSITRKAYGLTGREIEICNMVKGGLSTKEIAELLSTSPQTVEKHRNRIRKKLGLANKRVNLTVFLQSNEATV